MVSVDIQCHYLDNEDGETQVEIVTKNERIQTPRPEMQETEVQVLAANQTWLQY